MARAPDEKIEQAKAMYLAGQKGAEIASLLCLSERTIRRWKSRYGWETDPLVVKNGCLPGKRGAPLGNQNAVGHGAPKENKNAEKYGFFSKYLPEETVSIIQEMPTDPLDILWDQIQLSYAAIIRAQTIMYVHDRNDMTVTKVKVGKEDQAVNGEAKVQQAWDKYGNFLQAQARAQKTLESLIKQYEELLHRRWDLATEEQKARIAALKAKVNAKEQRPIRITFTKAGEADG